MSGIDNKNPPDNINTVSNYDQPILQYWKNNGVYAQISAKNKNNPIFRFVDGPPFPNSNNLHLGHILIGTIKITILFYMMNNGLNCLNKLGYDCHGLPIETKANEKLD